MTIWVNRALIAAPRNGTTSHTIDPSSATGLVNGATFTPTAGRLLVAFLYGGVTSTTPTGWTLPTNGFASANGGLYMFYKTAAGSDTLVTTHNGSNYIIPCEMLEFASGSAFLAAASATGVANGGVGPSLTMAAGTKLVMGVVGWNNGTSTATPTASWGAGVESTDYATPFSATDAVQLGTDYLEDSTLTTSTLAATTTIAGPPTAERLMVAITVATSVQTPRPRRVGKRRW